MIGHYTATSGTEIAIPGFWNTMTVQVDGASSVTIQGKMKQASNYASIAAIKLADYSTVSTLSTDGLYSVDLSGLDFIKFTFSGSAVYYNVE